MTDTLLVVIIILMVLLLAGGPVIFAIGTAGFAYFVIKPGMWASVGVYPHKFFTGMDDFVWLCIPLFIMAGEIMATTGMTEKLVTFAQLLVGRFRGGLAYVNVLDSMLFGGVSGSALADISALGPIVIDMMKRDGYKPEFATALTVTTALQGPIIPPSIPMIIFASLTNVSVGALFMGGVIPGIMIGLAQAIIIFFMVKKYHFPSNPIKQITFKLVVRITSEAGYALMMPVIILGGIISGFFTATEAAAIAVGYAACVGIFISKNLNLKQIFNILEKAARTSAAIYLIIGFVTIISWVFARERLPDLLTRLVNESQLEPWQLLLLVNIFFLFNGMWISDAVQLLLFAPLFTPIFAKMGVHPVHFGIIMVVNIMIGLVTPPYGMGLYLGSIVGKVPLTSIIKTGMPFIISSIVVLLIITYIPFLCLWVPSLFGLIK
ncbi:MAG: TRAP transporter large permease [Deltaproteobacteria bacterium]|nr:TRAP transporter large permease [Deltaproteobacteria bacterium]